MLPDGGQEMVMGQKWGGSPNGPIESGGEALEVSIDLAFLRDHPRVSSLHFM